MGEGWRDRTAAGVDGVEDSDDNAQRSSPETERSMDQPVMTFDLPAILADLKQEPTWRTARRTP
jgi:hypothetical protein